MSDFTLPQGLKQLIEEGRKVRHAIKYYGGSFIQKIGEAMDYADMNNLSKIRSTWAHEWAQYLDMYEKGWGQDKKEAGLDVQNNTAT